METTASFSEVSLSTGIAVEALAMGLFSIGVQILLFSELFSEKAFVQASYHRLVQ